MSAAVSISNMNRSGHLLLSLILLASAAFTGCAPSLFLEFYGVKKIRPVDQKTIAHYSRRYNIPTDESYELDTAFFSFVGTIDTSTYREQIKNHLQPLQAIYFDNSGYTISYQVNCYAGGFPNLNWERDGIFTVFPPLNQAPIDSLIPLDTLLRYLNPNFDTVNDSLGQYDVLVVVYWSRFMGRQSRRFIRFVQENRSLSPNDRVKILYVNNDNLLAKVL